MANSIRGTLSFVIRSVDPKHSRPRGFAWLAMEKFRGHVIGSVAFRTQGEAQDWITRELKRLEA